MGQREAEPPSKKGRGSCVVRAWFALGARWGRAGGCEWGLRVGLGGRCLWVEEGSRVGLVGPQDWNRTRARFNAVFLPWAGRVKGAGQKHGGAKSTRVLDIANDICELLFESASWAESLQDCKHTDLSPQREGPRSMLAWMLTCARENAGAHVPPQRAQKPKGTCEGFSSAKRRTWA